MKPSLPTGYIFDDALRIHLGQIKFDFSDIIRDELTPTIMLPSLDLEKLYSIQRFTGNLKELA